MSKYVSTRNSNFETTDTFAIISGLAKDKGLFVPKNIKKFSFDKYDLSNEVSFKQISYDILSSFFDSLIQHKLISAINEAYNLFDNNSITPTTKIGDDYILELYHGPTSAFKDVALTILPYILSMSYEIENINKLIYILCATSGDTGKAALEGFKNVKNTYITVFYPNDAVSKIQQMQMLTTTGNNTNVVAVDGNFDDCQKIVKNIMEKRDIILNGKNILFSSANSINIGRLVPQIVYYFKSYFDLVHDKQINFGDKINFVVPTGNFGDILAGYIAKMMSLPIEKLICASNENHVLTDFLNTGIYDINRTFYNTYSPSMDILISSNLERLLYLYTNDSEYISYIMDNLSKNKKYEIEKNLLNKINETFVGYYIDDNDTTNYIKSAYYEKNKLIDPHTAVAYGSANKFFNEFGKKNKAVILSTASPYKFPNVVLKSIKQNYKITNDFSAMEILHSETDVDIPKNLCDLQNMKICHNDNIKIADAENYIKNKINILNKTYI